MKVRALAALLLVAFPAVAIAQSRVPGVTDTEIVIGLTAPAATRSSLVFPAPAGPTRPAISPGSNASETGPSLRPLISVSVRA